MYSGCAGHSGCATPCAGGAPSPRTCSDNPAPPGTAVRFPDRSGGCGASAVGACRVGHAGRGGGRDGSGARGPAGAMARGGARLRLRSGPAGRVCDIDGRCRGSGRADSRPVRDGTRVGERGVDGAGDTALLRHRHPGRPAARPRVPPRADRHRPGTAAVTALFAAPTGAVPGHRNTWPAGSALAAPVTHADGVVTVDLTARAPTPPRPTRSSPSSSSSTPSPERWAPTDPVQVLVAGQQVPRLWGDGVDTSRSGRTGRPPRHPGSGRYRRSRRWSVPALPGADRGGGGGVRGHAAVGDPAERVGRAVRQRVDRRGSEVRAVRLLGRAAAGRLRGPRGRGRPVGRRRAPGHDRHAPGHRDC